MTHLLKEALAEVNRLSESDQDAIAKVILEELADEARWDVAFVNSQGPLAKLAAKARDDIHAGRVTNKGMDEL